MKYTVIVIDDDPLALRDARYCLKALSQVQLVETFSGVAESLAYFEDHEPVDIILCDLVMPETNGIDAAALLKGFCGLFLMLTGHPNREAEALKAGAVDYIPKPLDTARLLERMSLLSRLRRSGDYVRPVADFLLLFDPANDYLVPVKVSLILRMEVCQNYTTVYLRSGSSYLVRQTLRETAVRMKRHGNFLRISKSAVIATDAIKGITKERVILLEDNEWYKVGETYRKSFDRFASLRRLD